MWLVPVPTPSMTRLILPLLAVAIGAASMNPVRSGGEDSTLGAKESPERQRQLAQIGARLFFDDSLSEPRGQSCASCHQPQAAFADPRPVSVGAAGREGRRNAPSLMYAALIPNLAQEDLLDEEGVETWVWQGGLFQDGSARTLALQIAHPLFDLDEMGLRDVGQLAQRLRAGASAEDLRALLGAVDFTDDATLCHAAYRSFVEFLKEPVFRPFDARIDRYLAGDATALTEQEARGLVVYRERGKCADCHFLHAGVWSEPVLSDYGFDNLGVPSRGARDPGLAGHTRVSTELGQFRAPSLRNVALTAPYFHNGSIATLREVMEFYNERDVTPERWGATDYPETVNREDLGNLGLSAQEVEDLTALMDAFTDQCLVDAAARGQRLPEPPAGLPGSWERRSWFPDWDQDRPLLPPRPPDDPLLPAELALPRPPGLAGDAVDSSIYPTTP